MHAREDMAMLVDDHDGPGYRAPVAWMKRECGTLAVPTTAVADVGDHLLTDADVLPVTLRLCLELLELVRERCELLGKKIVAGKVPRVGLDDPEPVKEIGHVPEVAIRVEKVPHVVTLDHRVERCHDSCVGE